MFSPDLPLYPGTGFPACPGGGVVECPKPIQEAVIAEPDSVNRPQILSVKVVLRVIKHFLVLSFVSSSVHQ